MADEAITLRRAEPGDCDLYFSWVNDPAVRASAFHPHPIAYEDHSRWFTAKLSDADSYLYVAECRGRPIGQIRVDCSADLGEIDISIDAAERGSGYASMVLQVVQAVIRAENPRCAVLVARVKPDNASSRHAFVAAGFFEQAKQNDHVVYRCDLWTAPE